MTQRGVGRAHVQGSHDDQLREAAYGEHIQKITRGPDISGLYAIAAHTNFTATRYEYAAAQTQAQAIAKLLRDAHEQFTELKSRLESVVQDARNADMLVDADGNVKYNESKLTAHERIYLRDHPEAVTDLNNKVVGRAQKR
ncbi:hypothetical protein AMK26_12915 [Streptomyces sp. CB03234]|uniref:hypothetical protein n=1 Tax=Streptomyces sp. (strain CB03234) TaxID=1703937 RepID=UPI00093CE4F3|nr:hypothetical protein [Streptomyces sp. CB03234]OKK06859.1 hypothetical protein AMK26_12915 [Streptomyces sp. CB03234]